MNHSIPMPTLLHGDARALPLPDASVDLVCCSPPYLGLRDYGADGQIGAEATLGEFLDALIACTREMMRVLKPSGSIFVNLGDSYNSAASNQQSGGLKSSAKRDSAQLSGKVTGGRGRVTAGVPVKSLHLIPHRYAIRCIDELALILRQDQVWQKANGLPESVTDRTRRSHEYLFHLVKSPRYYSACDEIRQSHVREWGGKPNGGHTYGLMIPNSTPHPLGKLPGSVWTIPTQPLNVPADLGIDHFAAWPMEIPRRLILGWSPREVCTACGEGRRPVVERGESSWQRRRADGDPVRYGLVPSSGLNRSLSDPDDRAAGGFGRPAERRMAGYACACPDTAAPSTPGVVLDPFSGTGTTALVATMLGRKGIGVELNPDYIRLAEWRASDPKERARAAGLDPDVVAKVAPQLPGQFDLLDLVDDGEAS